MNAWEKPGLTPEARAWAVAEAAVMAFDNDMGGIDVAAVERLEVEVAPLIASALRAAVEQERAVCAVACEAVMVNDDNHDWREAAKCCAEVIRARSEVK